MSDLQITIPIQDWHDEAIATETPITSTEDIIELIEKGMHTGQVGTMALVWRELGEAPKDIMRPNKVLIYAGAQENVSSLVRARRHEVETKDGKRYRVPDYVGAVGESGEDGIMEQYYVRHDDRRARERAETYLFDIVPSHVWKRLLLIYENGGDVKAAGQKLKREITEQVNRLV